MPRRPVTPDPGLSGVALQVAQSSFTHCQNLQLTLSQDQAAVSKAQAQLPVVQAQAQQAIDTAQANANSAQAGVNLAGQAQSLQASPGSASAQAQAQANLNQAEAQVAQVQSEVNSARLVAPDGGIVTAVYGATGETLGPDGVHIYQAPAALPTSTPGFSLFPSQPSSQSSSSTSQSGTEPLMELVGGRQQILAQIPESEVASVPVGKSTTVNITALNLKASGVVTQVDLSPSKGSNGVTYQVIITLNRTASGLLPGMSATVVF